jgi:sulfatase modifying factor 1
MSAGDRTLIFISYRVAISAGKALWLYSELRRHFGEERVFLDVENLAPGDQWSDKLDAGLDRARVIVVVIGDGWLSCQGDHGKRRLDSADDWVRKEVAYGLAKHPDVEVIPVLVDGAVLEKQLPTVPGALPGDIAQLASLQATKTEDSSDLPALLETIERHVSRADSAETRVLNTYRASLRNAHGDLPGLFQQASQPISGLDAIYLDLDLAREYPVGEGKRLGEIVGRPEGKTEDLTLRQLMETALDANQGARRWVVLGDPGAGKSTLARHLTWDLATGDAGPLVVYASFPALSADGMHPFDWAEKELQTGATAGSGKGLAEILRRRAQDLGEVWLLLDGLDEVATEKQDWVSRHLPQWAAALPNVTIAIFSRPIGYKNPGSAFFARARIRELSNEKQLRLLENWLGSEARALEVWQSLQRRPGLRDACRVPLMISLLAFMEQSGERTPDNLLKLYSQSLNVLLRRGHRSAPGAVKSPRAARLILGRLALALQSQEKSSWSYLELYELLGNLREEDITGRRQHGIHQHVGPACTWKNADDFLEDVSKRAGVLLPQSSGGDDWVFLHRQFRELLAAEALRGFDTDNVDKQAGDASVLARATTLKAEEVPRWGAVLGFACELSKDPLVILKVLKGVDADLALRILPEMEGVDALAALGFLAGEDGWNGDYLVKLLRRWLDQGGLSQEAVRTWLWQQVTPDRITVELAYVHYALEALGARVSREEFFSACRRWPEGGPTEQKLVEIPGGTFVMGSPEDEPERNDNETQHEVTVSPFFLSATAVSNEEYERFSGEPSAKDVARHPVVNVSWWEANLYARWLGLRLPTEAEWEYACRAGTTTPFSFGKNVTTKQVNYDGNYPYAGGENGEHREQTVDVGSLPANRWGMHEMHGNVWEWCGDWYASYDIKTATDPRGPDVGSLRVSRGGSWDGIARYARAARRGLSLPGERGVYLGFRLARDQLK